MIILDEPYVSDLLLNTIKSNQLDVVENKYLSDKFSTEELLVVCEERAVIELNTQEYPLLYSNSENVIHWVAKHLKQTRLPGIIDLFKNKAAFRRLVQDMYPSFFFKEVAFDKLENLSLEGIPFPFIIKPTVGFFSLGVHRVDTPEQWPAIVKQIKEEV